VGEDKFELSQWVISRWNAEVSQRPLENIHRRTLDDTWRQVYRHLTGEEINDRPHDVLLDEAKRKLGMYAPAPAEGEEYPDAETE
jgi:hypothetical protein